jgi:hypothetical protein
VIIIGVGKMKVNQVYGIIFKLLSWKRLKVNGRSHLLLLFRSLSLKKKLRRAKKNLKQKIKHNKKTGAFSPRVPNNETTMPGGISPLQSQY